MKTIRIVFLPAIAYHISGNCVIFTNEVANAVLCYNSSQNSTIPLREHLGLRDIECHMGNYICALQEKEKYYNTCQSMKGKLGGAERTRQRDKNVKRENYGLYLI